MKSDYWEDKNMPKDILLFHEEELKGWEIPEWMNIKCQFCSEKLPLRSIRSIGFRLNTRNMGDLVLEILCDKCSKMDTVYFPRQISKVSDFIAFLTGSKSPTSDPIIEENMYKMQYNNVMEKMMKDGNSQVKNYTIIEEK